MAVRRAVVERLVTALREGVPADSVGLGTDATEDEIAAAIKKDDKRYEDGLSEKQVIGTS